MKLFTENAVSLQVRDLEFLLKRQKTPQIIKQIIYSKDVEEIDEDEYITFTDKLMIKYLRQASFILDIGKFSELSEKEISDEINKNNQRISKAINIKSNLFINSKYLIKENKDKLDNYYEISMHYRNQLNQYKSLILKNNEKENND